MKIMSIKKSIFLFIIFIIIFVFTFLFVKLYPVMIAKPMPYTLIGEFEDRYIKNKKYNKKYKEIDAFDFELTDNNPIQNYICNNLNLNSDVVFSFSELDGPINFFFNTLDKNGDNHLYSGSFNDDCAVKIISDSNLSLQFDYMFGTNENQFSFKKNGLINSIKGKIKVYEVMS